jgi:VanZ family protein
MAVIGFLTLCPGGLRPHLANADLERFGAYLVLGVLVSRAAGRRAVGATMLVMALAFGLEAAQRFAPGRHAQMAQALVKAFGGLSGVMAAELGFPLKRLIARLSGLNDPRWILAPIYVTSR